MKAFVFTEKGRVEPRELPAPVLNPADPKDQYAAILKPKFLSPCSSDAHTVYAGPGPRREDLVLGHEGLAEVVETGSAVRDFHPGDLVAVSAVMPEVPDGHGHEGSHFSATKLGRNIDGMWSELFKVPMADQNLAHIPDGVTPEAALMAVDMMATGYTAAEAAEIHEGADESILVIGSGAVALMAIAAARSMGAGSIYCIGTDKDELNRRLAVLYGAEVYISYRDGRILYDGRKPGGEAAPCPQEAVAESVAIDPRANATSDRAVDTILQMTSGEGVDRILVCGGGRNTYIQVCDMLRYGSGIAVNVAYIEGTGTVELPIFSLGRGMAGKTFKFMLSKGGRVWTERMFREILDGRTDPSSLITHHMQGFNRIPEALELMHRRPGGLVKIMVEV